MSVPVRAASTFRRACHALVLFALAAPSTALAQASVAVSASGTASTPSTPSPDAPSETGETSEASPEKDELAWDLRHRRYASWDGSTGGLFLIDGTTGEPSSLRLQAGFDTFSGDDFLYDGDHVEQDGQTFAVSWTATKVFEVYAALENRMSAISVPRARSLDSTGDASLGFKLAWKPAPIVGLGFDARALFGNQVGGGGFDLEATSVNLRSAFTLDLQGLDEPLPFITRINVGYLFDNSSKLAEKLERKRYNNLNGVKADEDDDTRHLVDRFERYATGVNRFDRLTLGVGFEVPIEVAERFYLHPMLEWQMGIGVNRQDYDCPYVAGIEDVGTKDSAIDTCYQRNPGGSLPMNLTVGVRAVPPLRGISFLLGVDFGLSGTGRFARELAPVSPYRVLFAFSYDYDARPEEKVVAPAPAPAPAPEAPIVGRIQGRVTARDGSPVDRAIVAFVAHDVSAVASSSDGRFVTEAFPPGEVQLEVSHQGYETARCAAVIPEGGGNVEASCVLDPKAVEPVSTTLSGRLLDAFGAPLAGAAILATGPTTASATSDVRGHFELTGLAAGDYDVRVDAPGQLLKLTKVPVTAGAAHRVELSLIARSATPKVSLSGDEIRARELKFQGTSSELDAKAAQTVAELADLLLSRPDLRVQIKGYGDDAVALSRSLLVKQRLVDAGVAESRLEAVGDGGGRMRLLVLR